MGYTMTKEAFNKVLASLRESYKIYAPVRLKGRGRFSDTDAIRYEEITKVEEIVFDEKSHFSPKEILHPIHQTLFYFLQDEIIEAKTDDEKILVFLRPCDIHGVLKLDQVFLYNGTVRDTYYEKLRNKVKFFMMECITGFDNCFCVSMEANKTDLYAAAIRFGEEILIDLQDNDLQSYFQGKTEIDFKPEFITKNQIEIKLPPLEKITPELFEAPLWKEYSERCIGCGRCNFACISCSCWTMQDILYQDNPHQGERRRVWSGCHVDGFTDMAGGHGFRRNYGDRMRFKTMHKIYDFNKRNGVSMCVGCGRCDDACPEYISFSKCIHKVTEVLEEGN
ncbi:anaerobic sulfite reductase subunit AsrA [Clostridium formicaceticum]|jgi:anaerobic sulfite reductase subunit A|uniref:Anaerobic sulfite reductase subunit A n=1 Tax=Clostridium formicaceticum TaxID=1497 RepID=A0AAC9RM55_9CLOT|nr:anaerobic sulfite reductase subunit AsrA [Clostridium formicaceticum]AOY75198.1 anaerobic sulfite reductase subunit A [Clostridium formicaceticum]ARE89629.1 Anaerobic sulfite reductase subunit A [Clostridium formicaceticum]